MGFIGRLTEQAAAIAAAAPPATPRAQAADTAACPSCGGETPAGSAFRPGCEARA